MLHSKKLIFAIVLTFGCSASLSAQLIPSRSDGSSAGMGINNVNAPLPEPLLKGKGAFISYELGDVRGFPSSYNGGEERAYAEFYSHIRPWGRAIVQNAQSILEVSTVKPHPDNAPCGEVRVLAGGRVEAACFTLETVLREGLNILPNQLTGGAEWVRHDSWDIVAKDNSAAGKTEEEVYREVLLAVAYERFSLKLHSEKRSAKGFALTVATAGKLGPGLTPASGQPHSFDVKPGPSLVAHAIKMSELAEFLRWPAGSGRVVEDKTGLSGLYDVNLRWTPLQTDQIANPAIDKDGPVIFTALRDQLGLKLVTKQVMQDSYEIQAAGRPGSN